MEDLLKAAMQRSLHFLQTLDQREVFPSEVALAGMARFDEPLPEVPCDPEAVLALLDEAGSPAAVGSAGPRYYGFVIGGTLPAALAAQWLAAAWDQNGGLVTTSPIGAKLEEVALGWLVGMLGLPAMTGVGYVTGATMGNFTALAAARHALLQKAGWDVEAQGLFGAPPITVIVGDEVHVSLLKALSLIGFGRERIIRVPVDNQGRMRADQLPALSELTLVCIQAGNVNTGAFDPAGEICAKAHEAGAWVHVDGAFGLWALAAPAYNHLTEGIAQADSWATDAHKWLNVPYDSGLAFVKEPLHLRAAMSASAAYLVQGDMREPFHYTPEMSRRTRGVEIWAALRSLGRSGLVAMIERNCQQARRMAEGLSAAGYTVLNDVVLNQVLVSFGDAEKTKRVIAGVQADGTCWCSGTVWQGHTAMRISVSSSATTDADVERSLEAILRVAASV